MNWWNKFDKVTLGGYMDQNLKREIILTHYQQPKNKGLIKTAFNFSTLFPIQSDSGKVDSIQRQIAAYKGQGGTAGLMNRFLVNLYLRLLE